MILTQIFKVIQLGTSFTFIVITVGSLISSNPPRLLFPYGCEAFSLAIAVHNVTLCYGGCFMAFFRLLCVKFPSYILFQMMDLVNILLSIQHGFAILHVLGVMYFGYQQGKVVRYLKKVVSLT